MSLYRPIFSIFFGNRSVFQEASPPKTPETAAVAGAEAPKMGAEVSAASTEQQKADLADLKEETDVRMEKTVVDYWMKNGVGKKKDAKECSPEEEDFRVAIESDRVSYALALMATPDGSVNSVQTMYYDRETKKFDFAKITEHFNEKNGYAKYGFYYKEGGWYEVDTGFGNIDGSEGSDFLTAWPEIVKFHAEADWNELSGGNVAVLQANAVKMSRYLAMAGVSVSYSGAGKDVADKGVAEAASLKKKYSRELIELIKNTGQNKPINIAESSVYKKYEFFIGSDTEYSFQYRYFPNENVIVRVGISGTDRSGRMYIIDPSNGNVDWSNVDGTAIRRVTDDTEKRKYLSLWYQGMSDNEKKSLYLSAAPEEITGAEIENPKNEGFFLDMTKEEISVDFDYVLIDRNSTKQKLIGAFKAALEDKRKDLKNSWSSWSDVQIAKAAELRAEKVLMEADGKLKAELGDGYYDYAFVSKEKFGFMYMSGGKLREKNGSKLKGRYEDFQKGLTEVAADAKEKVEETLDDIIAAAVKASGNENIDPAEVKEYVEEFGAMYGGDKKKAIEGYMKIMSMPFGLGVLVLKFMKPILNALKGSIGKMVVEAGKKADKASESVADKVSGGKEKKAEKPSFTVGDLKNCPRGEMLEKDKKREFADLAEELELPIGFAFEIGEIVLPEKSGRLYVTQNQYLQKGKHKNIKLLGGVKLPKDTKLSNVRVLKKPGDNMADVFPAVSAEGKYRRVTARAETTTEPEVADAAPPAPPAVPKAAPAPD